MKKTLALVLSVLMVLSCCTALFAYVALADGEGLDFAWASVWFSPDNNGTWQGNPSVPEAEKFDFDYTAAIVDGYLKVGIKYYGQLSASENGGNSQNTNLRCWIQNPSTGYVSYNYFFDVSKTTTGWRTTRFAKNNNNAGNTPTNQDVALVACNVVETSYGADIEATVAMSELGDAAALNIVASMSNKVNTNYCLHSSNCAGAPASTWYDGSLRVTADKVIPNDIFGESVAMNSAENSCWTSNQVPVDSNTASFRYGMDEKNLYIETTYSGSLARKNATSYGNGAGQFLRIWFYDRTLSSTQAHNSYNTFIDIEGMVDGNVVPSTPVRTRFLTNNKVAGANDASVTYTYDAAKPYVTYDSFDVDNSVWVDTLVMPLDVITTDVENLQFQITAGYWGEHPTSPSDDTIVTGYSSRTYGYNATPYVSWEVGSALPNIGTPGYFTDVDIPANPAKTNVSAGLPATVYGIRNSGTVNAYGGSDGSGNMVLTDGVYAPVTYDHDKWVGLFGATQTIEIDLGQEYDNLDSVTIHTWPCGASGIGPITSAKVLASIDGVAWFNAGNMDVSVLDGYDPNETYTLSLNFTKYLDARYIKLDIAGPWSFIDEVEVFTSASAYTVLVKDINAYSWDNNEVPGTIYGPVLVYGQGKTILEKVGGNWFNYWTILKAKWSVEESAFVVNAISRNDDSDLSYQSWVFKDNEIALMLHSYSDDLNAIGTKACAFANAHMEVGDLMYVYGLDSLTPVSVVKQITLEDGVYDSPVKVTLKGATLGDDYLYIDPNPAGLTTTPVPPIAATENIALGKNVTVTNVRAYKGDNGTGVEGVAVVDGVKPATGYNQQVWLGLGQPGSVAIDLGAHYDNIGSMKLYTWPANQSGITPANSLVVRASNNNKDWYYVGEFDCSVFPTTSNNTVYELTLDFDTYVQAQYIKVETAGAWVFISEIEVYSHEAVSSATVSTSYAYDANAAILATWLMGSTLRDINGAKSHGWWNFASVQWNPVTRGFEVKEVILAQPGGSGDARDLAIPVGGFIIGGHASSGANAKQLADFIAGLSVGDTIYVSGIDIRDINAADMALENVVLSVGHLENAFEFPREAIITASGYAAGDKTIFIPFDGNNSATSIHNGTSNAAKDYNYYGIIYVDADGYITRVASELGSAGSYKGALEIPEGGYAIGVHGSCDLINHAVVGDYVVVSGVDFEADAGVSKSLDNAAFSVIHVHNYTVSSVVDPTCGAEGYTVYTCVCGDSYHGDVLPATGDHDYVDTVDMGVTVSECSVCGDTKYSTADGDAYLMKISHRNLYNWDTFETMVVVGQGTANDLITNANVNIGNFYVYLVEEEAEGYYVVKSFYNKDSASNTITLTAGQFMIIFGDHNDSAKFAANGELVGMHFIDKTVDLNGNPYALDVKVDPSLMRFAYLTVVADADYTAYNAAVSAASGLVEADYTAESWAALEAALAVDVAGLKEYAQADVDAAKNAIIAAINSLEEVAADIVYGDFDGDGEFTSNDLIDICQYYAGIITADESVVARLDVDGDGQFTSNDLIDMCQYYAGIITEWSVNL